MAERYLGEGMGHVALHPLSGNRMAGHVGATLWPSTEPPLTILLSEEASLYLDYDGAEIVGVIIRFKQPVVP
jgi:hypothetical protein